MGKDIALTGKIDTEHRARQDVSPRAFSDDLFFFRHPAANIRGNVRGSRVARVAIPSANAHPHASRRHPERSRGIPLNDVKVLLRDSSTSPRFARNNHAPTTDFGGTGPGRPLANIREAPDVSTTRRSGEAHPGS